jgi:hypothetical protein
MSTREKINVFLAELEQNLIQQKLLEAKEFASNWNGKIFYNSREQIFSVEIDGIVRKTFSVFSNGNPFN